MHFSKDGQWIVSSGMDQTLRVWDTEKKEELFQFSLNDGIPKKICLSPNRQYLVAGTNMGEIYVWDTMTQKLVKQFKAHQDNIRGLQYSPTQPAFVSGSMDNWIKYWDTISGNLLQAWEHKASVQGVAISMDSTLALFGSTDKTMRVWNLVTGQEVFAPQGHIDNIHSLSLSLDGHFLVSGGVDQTTRVWEMSTGKELASWKTPEAVYATAISPKGSKVAGANYSSILIWNRTTGELLSTLMGHTNRIRWVHFIHEQELYSAGWDGTIRRWNVDTGALLQTISPDSSIESCSLLNPDTIACGHWNGTIGLWSLSTGKLIHSFKAHDQVVKDIACLENGKYMLTGSEDGTLKIWDTFHGNMLNSVKVGPIKKFTIFPSKDRIAIAIEGKKIDLFSLKTFQKIQTISQDTQTLFVISSWNETTLICGNANGTIYLFSLF